MPIGRFSVTSKRVYGLLFGTDPRAGKASGLFQSPSVGLGAVVTGRRGPRHVCSRTS